MKRIIALLLASALIMAFTLSCKPAEQPAKEPAATQEETAPATQEETAPATQEETAPATHTAPADQPAAEQPAE